MIMRMVFKIICASPSSPPARDRPSPRVPRHLLRRSAPLSPPLAAPAPLPPRRCHPHLLHWHHLRPRHPRRRGRSSSFRPSGTCRRCRLPRETAIENPLRQESPAGQRHGHRRLRRADAERAGHRTVGHRSAPAGPVRRPQLQRADPFLFGARGRARRRVVDRPGGVRGRAGLPRRPLLAATSTCAPASHHAGRDHQRVSRAADLQRRRPPRRRHAGDPLDLARGRLGHLRRDRAGTLVSALFGDGSTPRLHRRVRDRRGAPGGAVGLRARDFGAVARLTYEPLLATIFGVSAYGGTSGNTLHDTVGNVPLGSVRGRRAHPAPGLHRPRRGGRPVHRRRRRAQHGVGRRGRRGRRSRRHRWPPSCAAVTWTSGTICCGSSCPARCRT